MERFDSKKGLILIQVRITGKGRTEDAVFALDTGAAKTVINADLLHRIGYSENDYSESVYITTGSGKEKTHLVKVQAFEAFGKTKRNFQVLSYQLPVTTFVEGLLGLDFLRKTRITIDFLSGSISLE
ncbi:MAG: retropepsin-like aspartic protease [Bacteroidota bacterium]